MHLNQLYSIKLGKAASYFYMSKELGPQRIDGLLAKTQRFDTALSRVNSLIQNPGGNVWQKRFQLADQLPDEIFLDTALRVGSIVTSLKEKTLPKLTVKKNLNDQEIRIAQAEEDVAKIAGFVQNRNLPQEALTRAQGILDRLKDQKPSSGRKNQETIPKMGGVKEKQLMQLLLAKEAQGEIATWDDLRALYPEEDTASAYTLVRSIIRNCRRKYGRVFEIYNKSKHGYGLRKKDADKLSQPPAIAAFEITQEGFVMPDGTILRDLDEIEKPLLAFVITRTNEGQTTSYDEFRQTYIDIRGNPRIGETRVHHILETLNDKLQQADCIIVNTAPNRRVKTAFVFRKRVPEDEDQKGPTSTNCQEPDALPEIQLKLESRRMLTPKEQIELRATCDVVSKLAARKPDDINRNIRVVVGQGLPPQTTIPQIYGASVSDDDLKMSFINSFANITE